MTQDQARSAVYREHQVMTASPIERVIIVYDAALAALARGDMERALRGLSLLRGALDWEAAPELAPRLQAIYEYCEECIRERDYDTPVPILRELRDTWVLVSKQVSAAEQRRLQGADTESVRAVGAGVLNLAG